MKPDEIFASVVATIMSVFVGNAGGFVVISLIALVATWLLVRAKGREVAGMREDIKQLRVELKSCVEKHDAADRRETNMRTSIGALFMFVQLSGDRRLAGVDLPDLIEGRVTLKLVDASEPRPGGPSAIVTDAPE